MADKKMTKKDWFAAIREVVKNSGMENVEGALAFIDHEVELLNSKSSKTTMTKTQKENVAIMETIKDALFEAAKPVTITELIAGNKEVAKYTPQKVSALIKLMKDKGEVVRTEEKKKAYFSLAVAPETDDVDTAEDAD